MWRLLWQIQSRRNINIYFWKKYFIDLSLGHHVVICNRLLDKIHHIVFEVLIVMIEVYYPAWNVMPLVR
jgi:hypothetical protein